MRRILSMFKGLTLAGLKNPALLFWTLVFPTLIFVILAGIFSNVQKSVSVRVAIVDESATFKHTNVDFASYIVKALEEIGKPKNGKVPILHLKSGNNLDVFLDELKNGKLDAVVFIPKYFNTYVYSRMLKLNIKGKSPAVDVYTKRNSKSSQIAFSILDSVISSFNKRFWEKSHEKYVTVKPEYVKVGAHTFSYVDFLVPGILVMLLLTVALFEVTDDLLVQREKKVLRRLFVTPLKRNDYLLAVVLSNLFLNFVRVVVFLTAAKMVGAHFSLNISSVLFILYAFLTTIPMGFFVASVAKSANSGNAIANLLNFVFMFLGGLYFPIGDVPLFVKAIAYSIPTTYLANGLRATMKVSVSPTPAYLNLLIPLIWATFMMIYSSLKFKWEV